MLFLKEQAMQLAAVRALRFGRQAGWRRASAAIWIDFRRWVPEPVWEWVSFAADPPRAAAAYRMNSWPGLLPMM